MNCNDSTELLTLPTLRTHQFSETVFGSTVEFFVLKMVDSFFLWIGQEKRLCNLALAMKTPYDKLPSSTFLLGDHVDALSSSLAMKLSQKTGKQVFVSYNLPSSEAALLDIIHKRLAKEMKENPDNF